MTCVLVRSKSDQRRLRKTLHKQTNRQTDTTKIMVTWPWTNYYLITNIEKLWTISEERHLGVTVSEDLKVLKQCIKVINTASRILGMIRSFIHTSPQIILQSYKSLVRPHIKSCVQVWRPHSQKDIVIRKGPALYDKNATRLQAHTTQGQAQKTNRQTDRH